MWEAAAEVLRETYPDAEIITDASAGWTPPLAGVHVLPNLNFALRRGGALPAGLRRTRAGSLLESAVSFPKRDDYAARQASRQRRTVQGVVASSWHEAISGSAGVIFSGAGGINDDFAGHAVHTWGLIAEWAKRRDKPVAFIGQGIGPLTKTQNLAAAERMLSRADLITVRDNDSLALVRSMPSVHAETVLTLDWATLLTPTRTDREEARRLHRDLLNGAPFHAVSFHRRATTSRHELAELSALLKGFSIRAAAEGNRVLVIPTMRGRRYSDDAATAEILMRQWGGGTRANVVTLAERPDARVVRSLLARADALVATRYHALVFALSEGIPVVGVAHDEYYVQKLRGVSRLFGVRDNVFPVVGSAKKINKILDRLHDQRPDPLAEDDLVRAKEPIMRFLLENG